MTFNNLSFNITQTLSDAEGMGETVSRKFENKRPLVFAPLHPAILKSRSTEKLEVRGQNLE